MRPDVPSLRTVRLVLEVEKSFAVACERGAFRVVHYSLQSDHVHLVVEASDRFVLGRGMKSIAARVARAVNRVFERRGPVLSDRYHFRVLRTPREVRNALAYVLLNARRHLAKRLGGRRPSSSRCLDPASSGRWFDGWRLRGFGRVAPTLPDLPESEQPPPVAKPHTWLLDEGWRLHGLLSPHEVPGGSRMRSRGSKVESRRR